MTGKIFRYSFVLGVLVLLLCSGLFFALQYRQNINDTEANTAEKAAGIAAGVSVSGEAYLQQLSTEDEIIWFAQDGTVLFPKQRSELSAEAKRAEIQAAFADGIGTATRKSGNSGKTRYYYAKRLDDGSVIRLGSTISAAATALHTVTPVLWVLILVVAFSGALAFRAAKTIIKPINDIDPDHPEAIHTYPELSPLVARIQEQRLTIDDQIEVLHRRQKEFSALTDNMNEGFLLIDREGKVLSVNASARQHVPDSEPGDNLLDRADELCAEAAGHALAGHRSERVFSEGDHSWQLIASPVLSHKKIVGAVLLWMDVTEREQRERLRQEFSANISHELKTPLTSISGFAELMAQGTVPKDKVAEFSSDIHREAQRLIALVNDIIKLSKLDENAVTPDREDVDLYALSEAVIDGLRSVAEKQSITLRIEGGHETVRGIRPLLSEMVFNLCDNAIKYNRFGGSVTVRVDQKNGFPRLTVADTGIGIPQAEQSRVFERFYRVDKSHSKRIGGTGLGLSIVKHGAQYHNAQVSLSSEPGKGTSVELLFNGAASEDKG